MNRVILGVVMLTMSGVGMTGQRAVSLLEGTEWQLIGLVGIEGGIQPPVAGSKASLQLTGGRLSGNAGCNGYFGEYTLGPGSGLTLSDKTGTTMMACAPPFEELERRFLNLLSRVKAYRLDEETLSLLGLQGEDLLQFRTRQPVNLERTPWRARGINNGRDGVVSGSITGLANAVFGESRVSGSSGCNRYQAAYRISGDRIVIENPVTTRMVCGDAGIMEQEQQFLEALSRATTFFIHSGRLQLRDEEGALQIDFAAEP